MLLRTLRGRKGVTIVEFALVLPLFFMFIFGVIEFGFVFFVQHTLQFATREGARLGLVGRTLTDASGNSLSREASIIQRINEGAAVAVRPADLMINIYPIGGDYTDPANWQNTQDAGAPGRYMRVKTRYYYTFHVIGAFLPQARILLQAQATYRNELYGT